MVYLNISEDGALIKPTQISYAPLFSRFFSALLDYFILAPVVSFFIVMFFRDSVDFITQFQWSQARGLFFQLALFSVLLFTGLQTVFIYFNGATPGQFFLKLYVSFEEKPSNLFFQIWLRQLGFVFSCGLLGLPFLATIYHRQHRTFYDRLSECDVLCTYSGLNTTLDQDQNTNSFKIYESDKKFLSAGISTVILFSSFVFAFALFKSHQFKLEGLQWAQIKKVETKKCFVMDEQSQEERLKTALALNILNLTSDECTLTEAEDVFNSFNVSHKDVIPASNITLAYFVKYYISQKSSDQQLDQAEYFKYACGHGIKSELCAVIEDRHIASDEKTDKMDSKEKMKKKLLDYIGKTK